MMRSSTCDELKKIGADFVRTLTQGVRARVVALSGDLGSGKTNFAQGVAEALGVTETVASPTFVIEKIYPLPMMDLRNPSFSRLVHIDAYRLESPAELEKLGWHELVRDPRNLILIEWPEKVANLLPEDAIQVRFDIDGDGRIISLHGSEEKSNS
ncbi:tRNA (adenosine(37)-N6)-threonylcarbamoyltransferase complex ATPase subunit type 1 TsaE [Candidatus Kaiserbacteria bacterium]|nr:tRNA (adenosine(37)-N6)-threonylcarbamoyltransferase complex ATPase subunit type 1 TsaE [Candidatus Kaiserbacteria bacterium]